MEYAENISLVNTNENAGFHNINDISHMWVNVPEKQKRIVKRSVNALISILFKLPAHLCIVYCFQNR